MGEPAGRTSEVQYGVLCGDGDVLVTGTDSPKHSGRWLAAATLRMVQRVTWRNPDGDPDAQIVTRSVVTIYGPWQVLGTETEEPTDPHDAQPVDNPVEKTP